MPQNNPAGAVLGGFLAVWGFAVVIALALTVFWIVDVLRREFTDPTLKIVWLLVVVLLHGLGPSSTTSSASPKAAFRVRAARRRPPIIRPLA